MKKFVCALSAVAVLAACGGDNTEALDQQAKEAEATANSLLDQLDAATDSLGAAADSVGTAAVEHVEEAAH
ncbi:MAG TPA: hypothetical protein PK760_11925 [Flavobacteriales bacterium]|nr:hypothetical protein [Flavobacteriales bacterium]